MSLSGLIRALPKAELHLHIEGTLTPERMWSLAQRHGITLPYESVDAITDAYQFSDLQSFLDLYYQGADVLRDEQDFYLLMQDYLASCNAQNIVHAEIMFDPQTHTKRGVGFDVFMPGFLKALEEAKQMWGITSTLIMCFLRDLPESDAFDTLAQAEPWYEHITAVGLDSAEVGNPPEKFTDVFAQARARGFKCVAHAGEEGPPEYIVQALDVLHVNRIDHGVKCELAPALMARLRDKQIALTVCPQSNLKLCVIDDMAQHNILRLLDAGLLVTVNADDPSYFDGDLVANFMALERELGMTAAQLRQLVINGFTGSFLPEAVKARHIASVNSVFEMAG
ncbi:adenosine deaminase [Alteromonas halophila]|uniref:Adenine deaminase n=1 Tax=Alteromonas halophila TaxID=516698 RepID=A0A918MVX5_9ALTE|nr:adenosine deaminase [Alteromonas halophila]GGW76283.1 adenine deaminase [Alteromonas halophila]